MKEKWWPEKKVFEITGKQLRELFETKMKMEEALGKIGVLATMGKETAVAQENSDDGKGHRLVLYWPNTFDILDDLVYGGIEIINELDTSLRIIETPDLAEGIRGSSGT